jgi:hypothetical protein
MDADKRHVVFFGIFTLAVAVVGLSWWLSTWPRALPITAAVIALVACSVPVFRPVRGRLALCFASFALFATACAWMAVKFDPTLWIAQWIAHELSGSTSVLQPKPPDALAQYVVFAGALAAFICSLLWARDGTAMGVHPEGTVRFSGERELRDSIRGFRKSLLMNLETLDGEVNWSDQQFVPLQAHVEIRSAARPQRRIAPLMAALKGNNRHQFLLLLGEPGSGKSVALRKLARDLLPESASTGRTPVYLNLRDWTTPSEWSSTSLPTVAAIEQSFRSWALGNLQERLDAYARRFLDRHFDTMMQEGRFFFLLDSFDEIGALLEVEEKDPLVDRFSEALGRFLGGTHHSRGVLASRVFRKPTQSLRATCQLEIRPLTRSQYTRLSYRRLQRVAMVDQLRHRPDLFPVARNPFTAALLADFIDKRQELPQHQGDIFEAYLDDRLTEAAKILGRPDLKPEDMRELVESMASAMFDRQKSFELQQTSIPRLRGDMDNAPLLNALQKVRLIRFAAGINPRTSFTHRRFAEYLIARMLLRDPALLPLSDIPTDSLWRDTLVLYCEIAPVSAASTVARYCWDQMSTDSAWSRRLHCLRFLAESFRSQPAAIESIRSQLYSAVTLKVIAGDILSAKWALETCGVFDEASITPLVEAALRRQNPWLIETALEACRHLRTQNFDTDRVFAKWLAVRPIRDLWVQWGDLSVTLRSGRALRPLLFTLWALLLDSWFWVAGLLASAATLIGAWLSGYEGASVFAFVWLPCAVAWLYCYGIRPAWLKAGLLFNLRAWILVSRWALVLAVLLLGAVLSQAELVLADRLTTLALLVSFSLMAPIALLPLATYRVFRKVIMVVAFVRHPHVKWRVGYFTVAKQRLGAWLKDAGWNALAMAVGIPFFGFLIFSVGKARDSNGVASVLWALLPTAIGVVVIGAWLRQFAETILHAYRDWRTLSAWPKQTSATTRQRIAAVWDSLNLRTSRRIFVGRLGFASAVSGDWPADPPYKDDDWASGQLARLDERWRGLQR